MSLYDLQQETAKIAKQIEDRIHATELEKAQFAMEAKNAKDRCDQLRRCPVSSGQSGLR